MSRGENGKGGFCRVHETDPNPRAHELTWHVLKVFRVTTEVVHEDPSPYMRLGVSDHIHILPVV